MEKAFLLTPLRNLREKSIDCASLLAARKIRLDEAQLEAERPESDGRVLQGNEELHEEQRELIQR